MLKTKPAADCYSINIYQMENYTIRIELGRESQEFQVSEHPHNGGSCKYKIYQNDRFVAGLEPDGQDFLHICQNPEDLDIEILHLLAEEIEARHPSPSHIDGLEHIEFDDDDELEAPIN